MVAGKACTKGTDIYAKPQKLDVHKCLVKCSRIKTCGMIDVYKQNGTCVLKETRCSNDDLTPTDNVFNILRLGECHTVCLGCIKPHSGLQ